MANFKLNSVLVATESSGTVVLDSAVTGGAGLDVSTATTTVLNDKAPLASPTLTGNVTMSGTLEVTGNTTHNGNVIMATNKKVQQKGAFMENSVYQSWVLGG